MSPSLQTLIKIQTTRALDFLWILSGRIFGARILGGKKIHILSEFDEILINRADRFGDAIISRPFLAIFARHVREMSEQGGFVVPKIRIIASAYNADFLRPLEKDGVIVEVTAGVTSYDYDRSIWYALKRLLSGFVKGFSRVLDRKRSRLAFVDLVDSVTEGVESDFPGRSEAVWISSNRGPYSLFFDYAGEDRFSGSTKRNLIETYIDLFWAAFSLPDLRNRVYAQMSEFYARSENVVASTLENPAKPADSQTPILCLVGVKEFRNFSAGLWHRIIVAFAKAHADRIIEVIDAPDNLLRGELEKFEYPENVRIIDNPHPKSLADFAAWTSSRYALAFGVDGGGINALRPFMDVCVAYTLGNHEVWSAFYGPTKVVETDLGDGWILRCVEVVPGNRQSWIFKKAPFLPSFQIPIGKECFDDLDVGRFSEMMRKL